MRIDDTNRHYDLSALCEVSTACVSGRAGPETLTRPLTQAVLTLAELRLRAHLTLAHRKAGGIT